MINDTNALNNYLSTSEELFTANMVPSDKLNLNTHAAITNPNSANYFCDFFGQDIKTASKHISNTKDFSHLPERDTVTPIGRRVQVQHLQTHTKLQNNRWSYHTIYNGSSETFDEQILNNNNSNNNNNINKYNESAFIECNEMGDIKSTSKSNANQNITSIAKTITITSTDQTSASDYVMTGDVGCPSPIHRTEDQENAFRRIEDVHNYAKLNYYASYSQAASSNSSIRDDDEEDDDAEDEDIEMDDNLPDNIIDTRKKLSIYGKDQQQNACSKHAVGNVGEHKKSQIAESKANTEHSYVDVESVQKDLNCAVALSAAVAPDHHARRPMNAFLIFCKRHRAIVKERYKSLENRAITKILGDWWASLDTNDKKCFTILAQQNKDAFFSANPNFKWYKLPAPPLRTLNTRPSNVDRNAAEQGTEPYFTTRVSQEFDAKTKGGNYFKFADETQMGELNMLISDKTGGVSEYALQQVLGETSQFLSAHMPHSFNDCATTDVLKSEKGCKTRLHKYNSLSSNSSEEDVVPKKSTRSCKGKIYQELINSGQIAAVAKKMRPIMPKLQSSHEKFDNIDITNAKTMPANEFFAESAAETSQALMPTPGLSGSSAKNSVLSEYENALHCDLTNFDLEEKIKELPALSLDAYLQRKRITKKKRKFSTKKRNSHSSTSSNKSASSLTAQNSPPVTPPKDIRDPLPQAVGSQKRKARKESITRRDVSAIEEEVASLIPLNTNFTTINGCYYFNETATQRICNTLPKAVVKETNAIAGDNANHSISNITISNYNNENTASTSDLLILAEVAANRTELTN